MDGREVSANTLTPQRLDHPPQHTPACNSAAVSIYASAAAITAPLSTAPPASLATAGFDRWGVPSPELLSLSLICRVDAIIVAHSSRRNKLWRRTHPVGRCFVLFVSQESGHAEGLFHAFRRMRKGFSLLF